MKNVLLIEDDLHHLIHWKNELELHGFKVTCADSVEAALEAFPQKQWDAIAIDGCIGGDEFNSPPLIKKFKAESKAECFLIAASRSDELREMMLEVGCTHQTERKTYVPGMIFSLLRGR